MTIKTLIIFKAIILFNFLSDVFIIVLNNFYELYTYLYNYYKGYNDTWVFISGHTIPVALSNLNNSVDVKWIYDNNNSSLIHYTNRDVKLYKDTNIYHKTCKLSWLSAKLRIYTSDKHHVDYNIDDFIQNFVLKTNNIPPSLYVIFMCWCVYSKNWFKCSSIVDFHIIDDMGEETTFNLERYNNMLRINHKNNTISHC